MMGDRQNSTTDTKESGFSTCFSLFLVISATSQPGINWPGSRESNFAI